MQAAAPSPLTLPLLQRTTKDETTLSWPSSHLGERTLSAKWKKLCQIFSKGFQVWVAISVNCKTKGRLLSYLCLTRIDWDFFFFNVHTIVISLPGFATCGILAFLAFFFFFFQTVFWQRKLEQQKSGAGCVLNELLMEDKHSTPRCTSQ